MAPIKPDPRDRPQSADTVAMPARGHQPTQIGPYHIIQLLGVGGTGEVYLAVQKKPIKRRVALKLIKIGMDTREVIARFESERQALAMMNHPNVAQILDAGCTDLGRPYFVMEYVPGEPITKYCDHNELTLIQRLDLFVSVCGAIQHAHQKGIIHRDIKPSNIIVGAENNLAVPKVIDFGIAKATQQPLTEKTLYTAHGQFIGTPAYMSPEQADISGRHVDTRSDVYALGVLLYELLVGVQPFETQQFRAAGIAEIHRFIRDVNPPPPSRRLKDLGTRTPNPTSQRRIGPNRWHKQLKGELDWITMRAMAKEQSRRYQSASELATDVTRFLQGHPVLAKPPSTAYQLKKLIIRHKVRCLLLGLVFTLVVGSSAMISLQTTRIAAERDRANDEAEAANQISGFLVNLFTLSDSDKSNGDTVTAREILDAGVARIDQELLDQPLVRARLMQTMGDVYGSLALLQPAELLLEDALQAKRSLLGDNHLEVASNLNSLATVLSDMGDYERADSLTTQALNIREKKLGPDHPQVATTLLVKGEILRLTGEFEAARLMVERALTIRTNALGPNNPEVANTLNQLANLYREKGDYNQARILLERALTINEYANGRNHPAVANTLQSLANVLRHQGDYVGAMALFERALAIKEKRFGTDHPAVATILNNQAILLRDMHDYDGARRRYERALSIITSSLGANHPSAAIALNNLASVLIDLGEYEAARPLCLRAIKIREESLGPNHPSVATTLQNLASVLSHTGDNRGARRLFERALAINEQALGPKHPKVAANLFNLGEFLKDTGNYEAARIAFIRALAIMKESYGTEHKYVGLVIFNLACNAALSGDKDHALPYLDQYLNSTHSPGLLLDTEADFISLRGDPDFEAIVARWRSSHEKDPLNPQIHPPESQAPPN